MHEGHATTLRIEALLRPDAFAHPVDTIELVETHVSWVVLTGPFAYKIKKPVRFDFVDATSLQRRKFLCDEELRLNRRLAPQLYIDVQPIGGDPQHPRVGSASPVIEYAVRMLQFDRTQELSALLDANQVSERQVVRLADDLSDFHRRAARAPAQDATQGRVRSTILDNVAALGQQAVEPRLARSIARLAAWLRETLDRNRTTLDQRVADGAVRECHGDLHARNIVRWKGVLLPFDCLEFDAALRFTDVATDVGFLHMDLLGHGRERLAAVLLNRYLEVTGDYAALRVLRLYSVHAALVRARVDGLAAAADGGLSAAARRAARIDLACRITAPCAPVLALMHGPSGSGKSHLSAALVTELGFVRMRSDVERKRLAGRSAPVHASAAPNEGIYTRESRAAVYIRLLECAGHALAGGYDTVVDASFLSAAERRRFREFAARTGTRCIILDCDAPPELLEARIIARHVKHGDESDATVDVLAHQVATSEPLDSEELEIAVACNTGDESDSILVKRVREACLTP